MEIKYFDIRVNMFLCWALIQLHLTNLNPKVEIKWKDYNYMDHCKSCLIFLFLQNFLAIKYVNPIQCSVEYWVKYIPKLINSSLGKKKTKTLLFTAEFMHSDYFCSQT